MILVILGYCDFFVQTQPFGELVEKTMDKICKAMTFTHSMLSDVHTGVMSLECSILLYLTCSHEMPLYLKYIWILAVVHMVNSQLSLNLLKIWLSVLNKNLFFSQICLTFSDFSFLNIMRIFCFSLLVMDAGVLAK